MSREVIFAMCDGRLNARATVVAVMQVVAGTRLSEASMVFCVTVIAPLAVKTASIQSSDTDYSLATAYDIATSSVSKRCYTTHLAAVCN